MLFKEECFLTDNFRPLGFRVRSPSVQSSALFFETRLVLCERFFISFRSCAICMHDTSIHLGIVQKFKNAGPLSCEVTPHTPTASADSEHPKQQQHGRLGAHDNNLDLPPPRFHVLWCVGEWRLFWIEWCLGLRLGLSLFCL